MLKPADRLESPADSAGPIGASSAGETPVPEKSGEMPDASSGANSGAGPSASGQPEALLLRLDGFEGPLDLLLDLARRQKVDLASISILQLVDQYLLILEGARRVKLELAADWLVMAAWLAWLKSRLLTPSDPDEMEEGELAAETLAARLHDLQAARQAAQFLSDRPQLGMDVFARGQPEDLIDIDRSGLTLTMPGLIQAYLAARRRQAGQIRYKPRPVPAWTVHDALERLRLMMGSTPGWTQLAAFLPDAIRADAWQHRMALASTFLAGLELARGGTLDLRQDDLFGPIMVQAGTRAPGEADDR